MAKRMFYYRVGIGAACIAFEYHMVKAASEMDARKYAIGHWLHPDKGYDHVEVRRITADKARNYSDFSNCPVANYD